MKDEKQLRKKVRVKAVLCACLLALCVCAGAFAAMARPAGAAQVGAYEVFSQKWDSAFATARSHSLCDPFTGNRFTVPAGLSMLFAQNKNGVHAYCIQLGQVFRDNGTSARRAYSLYDSMFSRLSATAKENIALTALFGYPNRSAPELDANAPAAHVATQMLLWECALGYRDAAFIRTNASVYNAYSGAVVRTVYEAIALRIQEFLRTPSFLQNEPLELALTYDPKTGLYTQRFTDTNNSGAALRIAGGELTVQREGDAYIFSAKTMPMRAMERTVERADIPAARETLGPLLLWVDPACGAGNQLLFSGAEARAACWRARVLPCEPQFISTTAECTTIRPTTTAIMTTACTTTTGQTANTTTSTATTTTSTTEKTTLPACTTTTCTTTCTTTRTTTRTTTGTTAARTSIVKPPRTGDSRAVPVTALVLLCAGALGGIGSAKPCRSCGSRRKSRFTGHM